tara:strand:- start:55 stop:240 length:186 start_codon:yes stop_codon:yes gene_type:complete
VGRIIGYSIPGSEDHLIVDWNDLYVRRVTRNGKELWEETFLDRSRLETWLEQLREDGLVYM